MKGTWFVISFVWISYIWFWMSFQHAHMMLMEKQVVTLITCLWHSNAMWILKCVITCTFLYKCSLYCSCNERLSFCLHKCEFKLFFVDLWMRMKCGVSIMMNGCRRNPYYEMCIWCDGIEGRLIQKFEEKCTFRWESVPSGRTKPLSGRTGESFQK